MFYTYLKGGSLINNEENYVATIIFRNKILSYKGQEFENFFIALMSAANENFKAVKAYGNLGDWKNDGFDKTTGTFYQVFAPEDLNKKGTIKAGIKKLEDDFKGLYKKWNDTFPIKKYYFVANDRYDGVPAPIHEMAMKLRQDSSYSHVDIDILGASDLERIFNSLNKFEKQSVIGFIPEQRIEIVDYDALNETVNFLLNMESNIEDFDKLTVPDFDEKIVFNGLSQVIKNELTVASYQEGCLIEYFKSTPGVKKILMIYFIIF